METWGFYFLGMLVANLGVKIYEWGYRAGARDEMENWNEWMKMNLKAEATREMLSINSVSC